MNFIFRGLFFLFQDHNSQYAKDLIDTSVAYIVNAKQTSAPTNVELKEEEQLCKHVCRLVVVDPSYEKALETACRNLCGVSIIISNHRKSRVAFKSM